MTKDITFMHIVDGDKHDFNLRNIPFEIMPSLINALRLEFSNRSSALAAPSFRQERALQHQRHLEQCKKTGDIPRQQFIDFPL